MATFQQIDNRLSLAVRPAKPRVPAAIPRAAAPPPAAPAAAPAAPPPLPVDANRQSAIDAINKRLSAAGLPTIYNSQRQALAANTTAGLVEGGLLESARYEATAPDAAGNVSYRLIVGPDGRLWRQAVANDRDTFNSHGLLGSSFQARADRDVKRQQDVNVAQAVRQFDQGNRDLGEAQRKETDALQGQLSNATIDLGDWQRQQAAAIPQPATNPAAATNVVAKPAPRITPGGPQPMANPLRGGLTGASTFKRIDATIRPARTSIPRVTPPKVRAV